MLPFPCQTCSCNSFLCRFQGLAPLQLVLQMSSLCFFPALPSLLAWIPAACLPSIVADARASLATGGSEQSSRTPTPLVFVIGESNMF